MRANPTEFMPALILLSLTAVGCGDSGGGDGSDGSGPTAGDAGDAGTGGVDGGSADGTATSGSASDTDSGSDTNDDPPVGDGHLAFSDLIYAPASAGHPAMVTVWGLDLPNDPVVLVGGKPQTVLRKTEADGTGGTVWLPEHPALVRAGITPSYEDEVYDVIEFELSDVAPGDSEITVESVGGSLPFTVGDTGQVYFVAANGNNGALGSIDDPWADWGAAAGSVGPGDIVYFREGTYAAVSMQGDSIGFDANTTGAPGLPLAAVGYPGEVATITGDASFRDSVGHGTVAKFVRAGGGLRIPGGDSNPEIRFVGNDVSGAARGGGYNYVDVKSAANLHIYGNHFHDSGVATSNQSEGIYIGGWGNNDSIFVDHNHFTNSAVKGHIFVFGHTDSDFLSNLVVRYNYAHDPDSNFSSGVLISGSDGSVKAWVTGAQIIGNTFTGMSRDGIAIFQPNSMNGQSMMTTVVDRNVCFSNNSDILLENVGPGSTADGNSTEQGIQGADVGSDVTVTGEMTWPAI